MCNRHNGHAAKIAAPAKTTGLSNKGIFSLSTSVACSIVLSGTPSQVIDGLLNHLFRAAIQSTCSFILNFASEHLWTPLCLNVPERTVSFPSHQKQNGGLFQQSPSNCNALLLTTRELRPWAQAIWNILKHRKWTGNPLNQNTCDLWTETHAILA